MDRPDVALLAFAVGIVFGIFIGVSMAADDMYQKAVDHNVGYYDSKTKEFEWKESK